MPYFKVGVNEKLYYEEVIIEADDKNQAEEFYRAIDADGAVDVGDTDGLEFAYIDQVDTPPEYVTVFTKEECQKLVDEQEFS